MAPLPRPEGTTCRALGCSDLDEPRSLNRLKSQLLRLIWITRYHGVPPDKSDKGWEELSAIALSR